MYTQQTKISSKGSSLSEVISEVREYKDLFWIFTFRDLKVRYAQTSMGWLWVFSKPLVTLFVYTFVFNNVAGLDSGDVPYPLYVMAGMTVWNFFTAVVQSSSGSLIGSANMIKKIYFPKVIMPISRFFVSLVDLGVGFVVLLGLMLMYDYAPSTTLWILPAYLIITGLLSVGVAFFFSGLTIRYRDFIPFIGVLIQVGTYLSPIAYPLSMVPEKYMDVYMLNPATCLITGFRYSIFGGEINWNYQLYLLVLSLIVFSLGFIYFNKQQRTAADVL